MNYEQKYKEALSWMQSLYSGLHGKTKEEAERYFPELAVSEDERIRNGIIQYLEQSQFGEEHYQIDDDDVRNYIAWLEKQADIVKHYEDKLDKCACDNFNKGYKKALEKQGEQNHNDDKDETVFKLIAIAECLEMDGDCLFNGYSGNECGKFLRKLSKTLWLEKQGKHKTVISDDALREGIAQFGITQYQIDNWLKKYVDVEKRGEQKQHLELKAGHWYICHRAYCCRADHLTVKEGERFMCEEDGVVKGFVIKEPEKYFIEISTPADNLEPKFKVGDWIVYDTEEWMEVLMVDRVDDGIYHLVDVNGETCNAFFEEECNMRLWGIGDAKDGDVLVCGAQCRGGKIEQAGIYKEYIGRHGGCSNSFKIYAGIDWDKHLLIDNTMGSSEIYPATKEQRDFLFSKIKEAGYEWDSLKKELKKIEQKPTLSEDERIRKNCIHFLELQKEHHAATFEIEECIDWLKSLKSQNQYDKGFNNGYSAVKYNQWKPSEEQMEAIKFCCANFEEYDALQSLYNGLKNLEL